jgi:hypothetical protein
MKRGTKIQTKKKKQNHYVSVVPGVTWGCLVHVANWNNFTSVLISVATSSIPFEAF